MTMRKFRVTVDGEAFEVEVEELSGPSVPATTPPAAPSAAPPRRAAGPAKAPPRPGATGSRGAAGTVDADKPARRRPTTDGAEAVEAPLPGTVVAVRVEPGQGVSSGDVLVVLEAMKMQNEIISPRTGVVKEVLVARGDTVGLGDVLVTVG